MIRASENNSPTRRSLVASLAVLVATLTSRASGAAKPAKWDDKMELGVDFEINQGTDFRWRRPYVAVWVEDKDGKSVRTLSLWVQTSRRGPRWIPDLRRWYRNAQDILSGGGPDLVATVSSATRQAGKYALVWNGRDDKDKPVDQGTYNVCIEAAREHGTYQLIRKELTIGAKNFKEELAGNVEIKGATVEYRKRK